MRHLLPLLVLGLSPALPAQVANTRIQSELLLASAASDLAANGNTVYVARRDGSFDVVDVTTAHAPVRVRTVNAAASADLIDIVYHQNHVYALNGSDVVDPAFGNFVGVYIYSVAVSATNPVLIGALWYGDLTTPWSWRAAMNHSASAATVGGRAYLFVASEITNAVEVFDVTAPAAPEFKASIPVPAGAAGVVPHDTVVAGATLHIGWNGHGLLRGALSSHDLSALPSMVGVGDPFGVSPVVDLGSVYSTSLYPLHMAATATGSHLVVCDIGAGDGIKVFSVSPPGTFTQVGFANGGSAAAPHGIAIVGNTAHVAYFADGLRVFDITSPSAPTAIAWFDTTPNAGTSGALAGAWGVASLGGNRVAVSDETNGLFVVDTQTGAAGDTVAVTVASWKAARNELTVRATSTAAPGARLWAVGLGALPYRTGKGYYEAKFTLPARPAIVTVTSSVGGTGTRVP